MSDKKIGVLCSENDQFGRRDAFHVPCVLVRSEWKLKPGQFVRFLNATSVIESDFDEAHAIVDPFLDMKYVQAGEIFQAMVKPELVSGLVHYFEITGVEAFDPTDDDEADEDDGCRGCY